MTSEDCVVVIMASPIYTGQDPNRCSKNHRLFVPSQQSAISGKPCANRLNPLFRDFNPYDAPILSIDLLHRKAFDCFHANPFLPNGLGLLLWKLLTMACMCDLCIRHELIHGTLLSESISTLRLYFGTQWLW